MYLYSNNWTIFLIYCRISMACILMLLFHYQDCTYNQYCQKWSSLPRQLKPHIHSDLKCPITFGNWFWHLIVGNRSIVLKSYQQRPVFASKNHPRPQRPKRPAKSKTSNLFVIITIQCKIINKCEYDYKRMCFLKNWNFHFHYINSLKLHFVEYVKFSEHFQ